MTVTSIDQARKFWADREWVAKVELDGSLIREPQPKPRQPNPDTTWLDKALRDLNEITVLSERCLILKPKAGNPVACFQDPNFFRYVRTTAGYHVTFKLDAMEEGHIKVLCRERPVEVLRRNRKRWRLANIYEVWVTNLALSDDICVVDRGQ